MATIFFNTREAARKSNIAGKVIDNGKQSFNRWAKDVVIGAKPETNVDFYNQRDGKHSRRQSKIVEVVVRKSRRNMMVMA